MAEEQAPGAVPDPSSEPDPSSGAPDPSPETPQANASAPEAQTPSADAAPADAGGEAVETEAVETPDGVEEADGVAAGEAAAAAAGGDALQGGDAEVGTDQATIDELLKQANFEDPSALSGAGTPVETSEFKLPDFQQVMQDAQVSSIELLRDVDLNVKIELGRSRMLVEDVLKLAEGSVVELDKLAGDPVDVFVNDRLVARGEVLVLNDNFCVRINEIMAGVKEEGM
jgi:flagellar motor switch protein FliN/FliY